MLCFLLEQVYLNLLISEMILLLFIVLTEEVKYQ